MLRRAGNRVAGRRRLWRAGTLLAALAVAVPSTLLGGTGTGSGADIGIGAGTAHADEIRDQIWPVLTSIGVQRAWNFTRGAGVTVAVLDSGVDPNQQDLAGSVISGPDFTQGANPPGVPPKLLHGTNMASLIAGHGHGTGNQDGVIGVAPQARILSLRVILENDEPGFRFFNRSKRFNDVLAQGIRYAVDRGADVINMSLGKSLPTEKERQAIAYAISRGVVVVAAAGNEGASRRARRNGHAPYSYPASFPGVISVAAVTADHRHAGFSNRNSAVVVSAPGVRIIVAGPGDNYWIGEGTSPATAFVSGVAALIRSRHPDLPPALVTQAIVASTTHRPSERYDAGVGFGEVNAAGALEAADRLAAAQSPARGHTVESRFDPQPPEPITLVEHDALRLVIFAALGVVGLFGLIGSLVVIVERRRVDAESAVPSPKDAPARLDQLGS